MNSLAVTLQLNLKEVKNKMTLPLESHWNFKKKDIEVIRFDKLEEIVLNRFSPKYKYNTPKDLEVAKFILSKYKEITNPETQIGYKIFTGSKSATDFVAQSKDYDNLAIGIETSIHGDAIFGRSFDDRSIKLCFGHMSIHPTNLYEKILKKFLEEKFEHRKVKKYLSDWLSYSNSEFDFLHGPFGAADSYIIYEFHENFVSKPHIKAKKDKSIEFSYGEIDGGEYKLEKEFKGLCRNVHSNNNNPLSLIDAPFDNDEVSLVVGYDLEKITNKIYNEISKLKE